MGSRGLSTSARGPTTNISCIIQDKNKFNNIEKKKLQRAVWDNLGNGV